MQLQLLEGLNDSVDASRVRRLGKDRSPRQLSLCGDEEIQVPETHVCARDPADAMASHLWPDVDDKTCKRPLPGAPTIGVLNCQLVNLYLHIWARW
jgi:hypothetical protein